MLFLSVLALAWLASKPNIIVPPSLTPNITLLDRDDLSMDTPERPKPTQEQIGEHNFAKAKSSFEAKNYKAALSLLDIALASVPDNAEYLKVRSQVHSKLNQDSLALEDINIVITLEPNNARFIKERAFIHWKLKQFENVLEDCRLVG